MLAHRLEWLSLESEVGPGPRSRHGFVFDRMKNSFVLFGGVRGTNWAMPRDTWELCGDEWTRIRGWKAPPSRHRGAMVYDSKRNCTVLFGGQAPYVLMRADTWQYQDRAWTNVTGWFRKHPSPRCGHAMAFDESMGLTILFGGISQFDSPLGDTWTFDGENWERIAIDGPARRRYAAFAYDPSLGGCVLHGGAHDDNGRQKYGDTWLFRNGNWIDLGPDFVTMPRDDHGLAYFDDLKALIMLDGLSWRREVLTLGPDGWDEVEMANWHPRHQCSPMAYDRSRQCLVLHSGESGHGQPQFDETLFLQPCL